MKKLTILGLLFTCFILRSWLSLDELPPEADHAAALTEATVCGLADCAQLEADILRATVRIHLQVWRLKPDESGYELDESVGHATLRNGRTLVTHNHYALLEQVGEPDNSISVALYDSDGRYLFSLPLSDFKMTLAADETRLFTFQHQYHMEKLAAAGIQSATFADWRSLQLGAGMQVAQVDWDGRVSRVDWTTIAAVMTEDGIPRLLLNDGITLGGSGGGIFWNGIHIANNWQSIEHLDGAGNFVYATSVAPLNEN